MLPCDPLLLAALRAAPRRYRMPPLPADAPAARSAGTDAALAFALEAARLGHERGVPPPAQVQALFTAALGAFIREALAPDGGDPAFQALVLQGREPEVAEHVRLAAQEPADRRAVRSALDALAHPGKLRAAPQGARRDALARLHALASAGDWCALEQALHETLPLVEAEGARAALQAVLAGPALQRLVRGSRLGQAGAVQRYRALCAQRGPLAGSHAAAAHGRASARVGEQAERATLEAFGRIAALLRAREGGHRAVGSLRAPRGFPGATGKAKDEWDAAIVREHEGAAHIVLLAEVKASPAAATSDFSRLHRGLQRLAQADPQASYLFPCAQGELRIAGRSLRALQPHGRALPPHVVYCCSAPPEPQVQLLGAASKSVLAVEPASLAYAQRIAQGEAPPDAALAPVWDALTTAPRLRAALHQYPTAQAVREAMLHPQDLLAAVVGVLDRA